MLLSEISYQLLMLLHGGYVSDDERADIRFINALVKQYRIDYIKAIAGKTIPETMRQHTDFGLTLSNYTGFSRLETDSSVPKIITGKYGPMIEEIYSPYVEELPFSVVNRTHLRYSGNGKFNKDIIFVAYDNNKLYIKSNNPSYSTMESVKVAAIFQDPELVPGFDVESDDYPIDTEGVNYIKEMFLKTDAKMLLGQFSDDANDSSGKIKQ